MAKRKNVFTDAILATLTNLADLALVCTASHWSIEAANKHVARSMKLFIQQKKERKHNHDFMMGVTLAVPNYSKSHDFVLTQPFRPRTMKNQEILDLNGEMEQRLQMQFACAGFELTERYLELIATHCFHQSRREGRSDRISLPFRKSEFHERQPTWRMKKSEQGTIPYFSKYVGFAYRAGMSRFLEELQNGLTAWTERDRAIVPRLVEFYRLIEYCRHVTVHEFGQHEAARLMQRNKSMFRPEDLVRTK